MTPRPHNPARPPEGSAYVPGSLAPRRTVAALDPAVAFDAPPADAGRFDGSKVDFAAVPARGGRGAVGLQAQLVVTFAGLLTVALSLSCWIYLRESGRRIGEQVGGEAQQLALALAASNERAVRDGRREELHRIGQNLIRGGNVLFAAFADDAGAPVVVSSRDVDFAAAFAADFAGTNAGTRDLTRPRRRHSDVLGGYYEVVAPVLGPARGERLDNGPGGNTLLGYVAVGVSDERARRDLAHVGALIVGLGCGLAGLSIPLSYLVVRRLLSPIRELAAATRRVAAGDLGARVVSPARRRTDAIGDLGRSFNDMASHVQRQRAELADAAERLADANRDLEAKVEQRSKMFETANARLLAEVTEKEDFLRAVSHDLNAPLRNISGMVEMLARKHRGALDADALHRLERIKKNVEVETDLIAELLDLSRIKTRRQKMEVVDLEAMVWELRGLFESDLKTKGIELRLSSVLPPLWCERSRVRQIFQNLIDNAVKYMGDRPEKTISVGAAVRPAEQEVEFWVADSGPGFDPADAAKLFYVFRRGAGEAVAGVPGKGVGLASVKSIVETYSGKIWAEGRPGVGATFRFTVNGKYVPSMNPGKPYPPPGEASDDEDAPVDLRAAA